MLFHRRRTILAMTKLMFQGHCHYNFRLIAEHFIVYGFIVYTETGNHHFANTVVIGGFRNEILRCPSNDKVCNMANFGFQYKSYRYYSPTHDKNPRDMIHRNLYWRWHIRSHDVARWRSWYYRAGFRFAPSQWETSLQITLSLIGWAQT